MDAAILAEYRRLRKNYHHGAHWLPSAKRMLEWARRSALNPSPYPELDWEDGMNHPELAFAEFEYGHFTVRVSLEYDEMPDHSWIGEFGNDWQEGAIDIRKADGGTYHGRYGYGVDCNYFYPATEYRNQDWRFMKRMLRDEIYPVDLHVSASKNGHKLGDSWLGGGYLVDGEDPNGAFGDDIEGYIDEAIEDATAELENLCPMA